MSSYKKVPAKSKGRVNFCYAVSSEGLGLLLHYHGAREFFPLSPGRAAAATMALLGSTPPLEVSQNQVDMSNQRLFCAAWGSGFGI